MTGVPAAASLHITDCPYCHQQVVMLWAVNPATVKNVCCQECFGSVAKLQGLVEVHFAPLVSANGVWQRVRHPDYAACAKALEAHFKQSAAPTCAVKLEVLRRFVRRFGEYVLDATEIPHWRNQAQYGRSAVANRDYKMSTRLEVEERASFLEERIEAVRTFGSSKVAGLQLRIFHRLQKMFDAWSAGVPFSDTPIPVLDVEWELLPQGEWNHLHGDGDGLAQFKDHARDDSRFQLIAEHKPDLIYRGTSSFSGYLAFIFDRAEVAVLESPYVGNALYIMNSADWRTLSKLSKGELIKRSDVRRVPHTSARRTARLRSALSASGIN